MPAMTRSMMVAPLELGEDAEHLDHHPAGRATGVEGFGGGAEDDVSLIQVLEDLGQPADRAGEAVDAIDEQEVEAAQPGLGQRPLQLGPVQGAARHLVREAADHLPALLAADVRGQALGLGLQREHIIRERIGARGTGVTPNTIAQMIASDSRVGAG